MLTLAAISLSTVEILLIVLVLILVFGGFPVYRRWGTPGGLLMLVLVIVLILILFGRL